MSESEDDATSESDWPVSAEWLQNILKNHHKDLEDPAITIIAFSVKPGCDPSESVLSHIVAVSVQYCIKNDGSSDTHSLRLIIKMLPQDPFSRFFVTEAQFDLREIKFYTEVSTMKSRPNWGVVQKDNSEINPNFKFESTKNM